MTTTTPTAPTTASTTRRTTAAALGALAAANLAGYLLLAGEPNPGMAAASALPLAAALALRSPRRWVPLLALAAVATVVGLRAGTLSFDLVRPGSLAPFALAVAELAAAGAAAAGSAVLLTASRRVPGRAGPGTVVVAAAGTALAAATAAVLVVASPQGEDPGPLTPAQVAALPVVDMTNYRFEAAQLRAGAGQPVAFRFTNATDDDHSFAVEHLGVDVLVPSGRERVVVLDVPPGEHVFHCSVGSHREDGMEGRLVVLPTATTTATAATAPAAPGHGTGAGHHHG